MKKLTKQALLQTHSLAPSSNTVQSKKKSKTSSNSFTPFNKSATQSEINMPIHRYSIGTNETPLAMNQNIEYFAAGGQNAQQSQRIAMNHMNKPSQSQLAPNVRSSDQTMGASSNTLATQNQSNKQSNKVSTLKNKAAFEKFHPSSHATASQHPSEYSPQQKSQTKPTSSLQSSTGNINNQLANSNSTNTAVISKLSHYQKMSSGPSKRSIVRGSSKKTSVGVSDVAGQMIATSMHAQKVMVSHSHMEEKVKKSQSQSLLKMQAAQMAHQKDFTASANVNEQQSAAARRTTFKAPGSMLGGKRTTYEVAGKGESGSTKKLIFSFKKNDTKKITPPNVSSNNVPKPASLGHHRRVQSHGTQAAQNLNLKTEQTSAKVHSPKVEKGSRIDMFDSNQANSVQQHGSHTETTSQGRGMPAATHLLAHPALAKHYKQEHQLNKSKTSAGVSQASLNGSREQVSIISLNSFSRSTPKFTNVQSMTQSAMNYQASISRTNNLPAKMLSPQSQTQVKQSLNSQMMPSRTNALKEKSKASGSAQTDGVPQAISSSGTGVKKTTGKIAKHQKLRLKHTQSTVQPASQGMTAARQNSPEMKRQAARENSAKNMAEQQSKNQAQTLPRFDMKQISSRNKEKERQTRSTGSVKDQNGLIHSATQNQFQSVALGVARNKELQSSTPKDSDLEAVGEEFPKDQDSQKNLTYKVVTGPHHKKSLSYNHQVASQPISAPGIYNMYMGQVKQLKKQRITVQKAATGANNTQPTHFINLNEDPSLTNMIHSHASLESLKKNSSLIQNSSKIKMSVTGKAPMKMQLTMPPQSNVEMTPPIDIQKTFHDSMSLEQDVNQTEPSNRQMANQVPPSLTNIQAQGIASRQYHSIKNAQVLSPGGHMPRSLISSQSKLGTLTPQNATQIQTHSLNKNLTIKHKQLAKAIKQHHSNLIRQTNETQNQAHGPMTTKTLSSSNHLGQIKPGETLLREQQQHQQQSMRGALSPKNIQRTKVKNHSQSICSPHSVVQHQQNLLQQQNQNAAHHMSGINSVKNIENELQIEANNFNQQQFLSERKRRKSTVRGNNLDPLGERQKAWMSPGACTSSVSENESATAREIDFVRSNGLSNMMNPDGGSNSQQISAAIIKKIQNNYQVQVTNGGGYDSTMTTASAQVLNQITQKIKNEQNTVLPYLHALQEISEVYPQNNALNTLLSQIHQGISTLILTKEDQIQQSQVQNSNTSKLIEEKEQKLKTAMDQIQTLERNENETRRSVQQMTEQIDERDFKIDKLEQKIMEHQKRARLMFKKQMESRAEGPRLDLVFDGNCSELERQSDERRKVFQENEELQAAIDELNEDMAYGKQRENKLMFFLYILKQMGYPISEVFEREIKDVPTSRFSKNFDDEYKVMHAQLWKERKEAKKEAKLVQRNGFGIDRDEILIEQIPKSDRFVPLATGQTMLEYKQRRHSLEGTKQMGMSLASDEDVNFYPLQVGPIKVPEKPEIIPFLDINKVLIIKHRRAKGLSVSNMLNKTDSLDNQSQSSEESLDSRGRPKRCPKPRMHKKILDQYGIQTGARNILALESKIFKQKYEDLVKNRSSQNVAIDEDLEDELRYSLNSHRAESMQSQRI